MPIEVEGPDGKVHSFPDGTPPEAIGEQMMRLYGRGSMQAYGPQEGDATAASGAVMPNMQGQPSYRSDEDRRNLKLGIVFPHMQQIIQNTPGHAQRMEEAKKVGQNLGNLQERQRAGLQVLEMLHQLGETADEGATRGTLNSAIGPLNASPAFQRAREAVNVWDVLGTRKGYDLNNQLLHDVHGLTTAFISAAQRGGITMSDARQKAFEETMGAMMKATSKAEFDKIRGDADRIIRGTFGLAPGRPVRTNQPSGRPTQAAPTNQAAPSGQRYVNPDTGQVIQWDGKQWVRVN